MARGVALTLLLGVAPSAGHDALSLVQQKFARDVPYFPVDRQGEMAENFLDLSIHGPKRFRINMLKMVVNRDLPITEKCCHLAQVHDIKPYKSWGSISSEDKAWWKLNHCTSLIGATAVNASSLMPNCHRPSRIASLMRHQDADGLIDLYRSNRRESDIPEDGCTAEERKNINDTASGSRSMLEWPVECSVEYEQDTSGTVDRLCLSQLYDVSEECAGCTGEILRKWADDAMWMVKQQGDFGKRGVKNQTCFSECFNLRNCPKPSGCPESIKYCQDCMGPRLGEYAHCLGGPIKNQITMPAFFSNIIDVNWFSQR